MEGFEKTPVGFRKAALKLQDTFLNNKFSKPEPKKRGPKPKEDKLEDTVNPVLNFTLEKRIKANHQFLTENKGLDDKIIKKFGLGYCFKGMMAGRIVIPIHNAKGELVAYAGRAVKKSDEETRGKYLLPSGFAKSVEVFNFHRVATKKKLLREYGLIVVEGFFDAIKLSALGYENVVALMGITMSEVQEKLILSLTDKLLLFLDNDNAGIEATRNIGRKLINKAFIKIAKSHYLTRSFLICYFVNDLFTLRQYNVDIIVICWRVLFFSLYERILASTGILSKMGKFVL